MKIQYTKSDYGNNIKYFNFAGIYELVYSKYDNTENLFWWEFRAPKEILKGNESSALECEAVLREMLTNRVEVLKLFLAEI